MLAVGQLGRQEELELGANRHQLYAFGPARDNLVEREGCRLATVNGAVELGAIGQSTGVVNLDDVGRFRLGASAHLLDLILQAGFGALHALFLGVGSQELFTFLQILNGIFLGFGLGQLVDLGVVLLQYFLDLFVGHLGFFAQTIGDPFQDDGVVQLDTQLLLALQGVGNVATHGEADGVTGLLFKALGFSLGRRCRFAGLCLHLGAIGSRLLVFLASSQTYGNRRSQQGHLQKFVHQFLQNSKYRSRFHREMRGLS